LFGAVIILSFFIINPLPAYNLPAGRQVFCLFLTKGFPAKQRSRSSVNLLLAFTEAEWSNFISTSQFSKRQHYKGMSRILLAACCLTYKCQLNFLKKITIPQK
jgi:hypothetical protein